MSELRVLCLFSSEALRARSFFGLRETGWSTDIDQGRCEFVALVVEPEMPALATSGLFAAATLVCRREDLSPALASTVGAGAARFAQASVPFEIVPADGPVSMIGWLQTHAPELAVLCRADGEVRIDSPSWWRERARRHLAPARRTLPSAAEDLGAELREFVSRRGW